MGAAYAAGELDRFEQWVPIGCQGSYRIYRHRLKQRVAQGRVADELLSTPLRGSPCIGLGHALRCGGYISPYRCGDLGANLVTPLSREFELMLISGMNTTSFDDRYFGLEGGSF